MQTKLTASSRAMSARMARRAHGCAKIDCYYDSHLEGHREEFHVHPIARDTIPVAPQHFLAIPQCRHAFPLGVPRIDVLRVEPEADDENALLQNGSHDMQNEGLDPEERGVATEQAGGTVDLDVEQAVHARRV